MNYINNIIEPLLIESCSIRSINGELMIDFFDKVYKDDYNLLYNNQRFVLSEDLEGKPTLLANFLYNDENMFELLLHVNGISNPFSLEKDYTIDFPDMQSLLGMITKNDIKENESKTEFQKQFYMKDIDKIKANIEVGEIKSTNHISGKPVIKKDGIIIFGSTMNSSKNSQSRLLGKAYNKIFSVI